MGEAGTSRRRAEPSFDEQFESLFAPVDPPPPPVYQAAASRSSARIAAKAVIALVLGVAAGVLFLVIAAILFALRPR
jgi:alkanesulfonate monooxygenase SsuD/methylene tetrahydromethanopterin reductase-like flavin-dependent oxidoreductase (luciferase family)